MTEKIFLIGAGIVDVLVWPAERDVFETGFYAAEEISMSTGGDALNEATVLARLGKQPELCTGGIRNQEVGKWVPVISGITPVDTTGAGDCFAGGFLYALSEGCDLETCARFGNVCGSLAVETTGATNGIRDLEQVKERYNG